MLVKIVRNGVESEWFELTKQQHRALLLDMPEEAIVHIEDFYPGSPDVGTLVRLEFEVFTVMARDFILVENCQKKRSERHHTNQAIEDIDPNENHALYTTIEEAFLQKERKQALHTALAGLTLTQRRRLILSLENGLSYRKIASLEGADYSSVRESIQQAKRKIREILGCTPSKREFLSD